MGNVRERKPDEMERQPNPGGTSYDNSKRTNGVLAAQQTSYVVPGKDATKVKNFTF